MSTPTALLDRNVIVPLLVEEHQRHTASLPLVAVSGSGQLAVAAHSIAEAFATLTRRGERAAAQFEPRRAWAALEGLRPAITVLGLTAAQTLEAIGNYGNRQLTNRAGRISF